MKPLTLVRLRGKKRLGWIISESPLADDLFGRIWLCAWDGVTFLTHELEDDLEHVQFGRKPLLVASRRKRVA